MTEAYRDDFIQSMQRKIQELLYLWHLPEPSKVSVLNISENATFIAKTPDKDNKIILRVHRPDYHTRQEIESELLWIESLSNENIVSIAKPLELKTGGKIASIQHLGDERFVVGFEFLPGREPSPQNDLQGEFATLGAITAKLHLHAKEWRIPIGFKRKVWDFESMLGRRPLWGDWREGLGLSREGKLVLETASKILETKLQQYGKEKHRFGLIHADLRLANLIVNKETLSVIDFDDCGYSWYMYDFAAAVSFMEEDEQIPALQKSWVNGYRAVAELSCEDEAAIPMFIMLRRLLLTAWIASHKETVTAQEMGIAYTEGTVRLAKRFLHTVTFTV